MSSYSGSSSPDSSNFRNSYNTGSGSLNNEAGTYGSSSYGGMGYGSGSGSISSSNTGTGYYVDSGVLGSGNSFSSSSGDENGGSALGISPTTTHMKPGSCRPIANGVSCINLTPDAAQCTVDTDCPGLYSLVVQIITVTWNMENNNWFFFFFTGAKKCCFYACDPYRGVGICEHPVAGDDNGSSIN